MGQDALNSVRTEASDGNAVASVDNDVEAVDAYLYHLQGYFNEMVMTPATRGGYIQFALGDQY